MILDTFQSGDPKRRLGGLRRAKLAIESSDDEDDDDPVYCAAPFNQPDLEAMAADPSYEPPQETQSIYPREVCAQVYYPWAETVTDRLAWVMDVAQGEGSGSARHC